MSSAEPEEIQLQNPYEGSATYNCFGCSPDNPVGLKLEFRKRGAEVTSTWNPRRDLEGYPGVVHGGIQSTLCDETAAWLIHAELGTSGVTRELHTRYLKPAYSADAPFEITARLLDHDEKNASIEVVIRGASGTEFTKARGEFRLFPQEMASKRFGFPGQSAFFPKDASPDE